MVLDELKRAWLRTALAAAAAVQTPLRSNGFVMDGRMSAMVRFANRMRRSLSFDLASMRARYAAGPSLTGLAPARGVRVEALQVAGRAARRYLPEGARADMMYFHGGGFIVGSLDTHDALCRALAQGARVRVTSVEYRLAPEHPFPAAYDDTRAAWAWAREQAGAGSGAWLIGGDSAGANLAAVQALDGSARLQVLIYPVVDLLHQDGRYPSLIEFWEGYLLTAEGMRECARLLLRDGQDAGDTRLSPIRAELSQASPALVVTAGFDPLRDQGRAYVAALRAAGVRTHLLEERGLTHGFADFAGVVPEARRAIRRIAAAIGAELDGMEAGR